MEDPWADDEPSSPARFSSEDIWGTKGNGHPAPQLEAQAESSNGPERELELSVASPPESPETEKKESDELDAKAETQLPSGNVVDDFGDLDDDDFAAPAAPSNDAEAGEDDEFGDFGDFGDVDLEPPVGGVVAGAEEFVEEPLVVEQAGPALAPLVLTPFPPNTDLISQIQLHLSSLYSPPPTSLLSDEPIRQVEGISQLLVTESSRDLYAQLTTPPELKGLDWTRSRVRREHLISLGVPVNLDEVDSHRLHPLPPLRITTQAPTPTNKRNSSSHPRKSSSLPDREVHNSSPGPSFRKAGQGSEKRSRTRDERDLGERPEWERARGERLLEYRGDQLSLVPPKYLARLQDDLVEACSKASALLAWLKQMEEIRTDESKRNNEQIAVLISQAQRLKTSSGGGGGLFRSNSRKQSGGGASGRSSPVPGKAGSPATFGSR